MEGFEVGWIICTSNIVCSFPDCFSCTWSPRIFFNIFFVVWESWFRICCLPCKACSSSDDKIDYLIGVLSHVTSSLNLPWSLYAAMYWDVTGIYFSSFRLKVQLLLSTVAVLFYVHCRLGWTAFSFITHSEFTFSESFISYLLLCLTNWFLVLCMIRVSPSKTPVRPRAPRLPMHWINHLWHPRIWFTVPV